MLCHACQVLLKEGNMLHVKILVKSTGISSKHKTHTEGLTLILNTVNAIQDRRGS